MGRGRVWAQLRSHREELAEAGVTVGLVVLLLEDPLGQLRQAEGAGEVLGVELVAHGADAAARDGLSAPAAEGPPALVVVQLTEGPPVQLEEGAGGETAEAVLGGGGRERQGVRMSRRKVSARFQPENPCWFPTNGHTEVRISPLCKPDEQMPTWMGCFVFLFPKKLLILYWSTADEQDGDGVR